MLQLFQKSFEGEGLKDNLTQHKKVLCLVCQIALRFSLCMLALAGKDQKEYLLLLFKFFFVGVPVLLLFNYF